MSRTQLPLKDTGRAIAVDMQDAKRYGSTDRVSA